MKLIETIYLADDHELVAKGLSSLLLQIDSVKEVKTFKNGKELFQACLNQKPDLIFLDYEMPIWNGKETLIKLQESYPTIPVYMLSMMNEKAIIESVIEIGARGFLNKDCSFDELKESIFLLSEEEVYYSKEVLKSLSGIKKKGENQFSLKEKLSERELEILALLCDGLSPKELGDKLFLSPRTIETHKNNIMQKFEVNSIAKLISVALKNNLV